jgi:C-terminal processing protease CtpA/Prc
MLGIKAMSCSCSQTIGDGKTYWSFQSEPRILSVHRDGPAYRKLKQGDAIVALDGLLITTRKAGVLFANLKPGEPVTMTVDRRGETMDVTIVPEEANRRSRSAIRGFDSTGTWTIPDLSEAIEDLSFSIGDTDLSDFYDLPELPDLPDLPDLPELPELPDFPDLTALQPRGWFGFGLSMSGSINQDDDEDTARWRFDSSPTIRSIEPDSPADRAGLREGDKLTHIDGVRIDSNRGGRKFSNMEPGDTVEWTYERKGKSSTIEMTAEERPVVDKRRRGFRASWSRYAHESLYSGKIGETQVDVVGSKRMKVYEDPETGELVIESRDGTVRLKKTDGE